MKTAIAVGSAYYNGEQWDELVEFTQEADKLGVNQAWSAEAWGMDSIVPLAYLAAKTENIQLGTGILQISSRVPSMIAMTAQSMATVSKDRFILGLGVSGPQVVEGLHGQSFAKPLGRLRECIDIVKMGLRGDRVQYQGEHYLLPRAGGEGKPIRLSQPPRPNLPIYLATLGPKALELTGELADGWLGTSFIPEHADVFLDPIRKGAEKVGRSLEDIDIQIGGSIEVGDNVEQMIAARKPGMAFTLGGMGSAKTNFYNAAFRRSGYADVAEEVQALWVAGKKSEAIARVPDELILKTSLIGSKEMIIERLRAYKAAGVNTFRLGAEGDNLQQKLQRLGTSLDLVRSV